MKKLLTVILGLVVLLVVALVALPFVISTDSITSQIVATVKEKTGRELKIGSDPKLSVFPSIAIEATDVALSNPGGLDAGALISMGEIKVDLALLPLLRGDVNIDRFILVKPVIALAVDKDGLANWSFDNGTGAGTGDGGNGGTGLGAVHLGQIEVVDGVLSYSNARSGAEHKATGINLALTLPDLASPLQATGSADWNGEKVTLDVGLGAPETLMAGKATPLDAKVTSPHITTSFKGSVSAVGSIVITGSVDAKSPSLRDLARWAGVPLAPGNGLGPFTITSKVNYADKIITASDAKISLDGMNGQGSVIANLGGVRPEIRASLGVDKVDVNQYLSGGGDANAGGSRSTGWSDDAYDFSGLAAVDAELKLAANAISYRNIKIGKSALDVTIRDGSLTAKLTELALYGGKGAGTITLGGATPKLAADLAVSGIDAHPLLADAMGMKWLEGKGELAINVAATGASQRQMIGSLGGNAKLLFTDGAIRGVNIPQMIRSLGSNPLKGWSGGETQKTDFSSFSASFKIARGIASNSDMQLIGPLVRMTGAGTVNLPSQSLDYKVQPKLVASLEGQGGMVDLSGLDIPVIIRGPWSNPQIYPDIEGILKNPEAAYEAIKNAGKGIGGVIKGKPEDVLNNLLGNQSGEESVIKNPVGSDKKDPIGDVLKKLF